MITEMNSWNVSYMIHVDCKGHLVPHTVKRTIITDMTDYSSLKEYIDELWPDIISDTLEIEYVGSATLLKRDHDADDTQIMKLGERL